MKTHASLDKPTTPPKLVVLLGALALKTILGKQKLIENRGIFYDCEMFNCKAIATYHLNNVLRDPNLYDTLKADLEKARDCIQENQVPALPKVKRELINSKERFLMWMKILADPAITERYADIETNGLTYFKNIIKSCAFLTEIDNELYGIGFLTYPKLEQPHWWWANLNDPEIREALQAVLKYPIDFHRGLFDIPWFWHRGFDLNFGGRYDGHAPDDQREHEPKLKTLVTIYSSEGAGYEQKIKEEMGEEGVHGNVSAITLLEYHIDDVYHGHVLKKKFAPMVKKKGKQTLGQAIRECLNRVFGL